MAGYKIMTKKPPKKLTSTAMGMLTPPWPKRCDCPGIGSPVGGPHSLGEIRGAAAVGKASAAARNFLRVPSAPRAPMAMALTQAPRTGALVPMGVGVARLFLKKF